jgi:hypothetical protein
MGKMPKKGLIICHLQGDETKRIEKGEACNTSNKHHKYIKILVAKPEGKSKLMRLQLVG